MVVISDKNELFKKAVHANAFDVQKNFFVKTRGMAIFDVGAQYGQTAIEYYTRFPNSSIYSFEPFKESYDILKNNVSNYPGIKLFNIAFGGDHGIKKFNCNTFSATNSFLETEKGASAIWGDGLLDTIETTDINVTTIDDFAVAQNIQEIDILKIDVQGYEFNVLEGAKNFLSKDAVKVIYMEIIILPTYKKQKHLDELLALMRLNNFTLYNLYNFSYDTFGSLRQVDAIFINGVFKEEIFA